MADNFHGVLVFVGFVVYLVVTKILPTKTNASIATAVCEWIRGGWSKASWKLGQVFSVLASNGCH
jgi:hypothetical protein